MSNYFGPILDLRELNDESLHEVRDAIQITMLNDEGWCELYPPAKILFDEVIKAVNSEITRRVLSPPVDADTFHVPDYPDVDASDFDFPAP